MATGTESRWDESKFKTEAIYPYSLVVQPLDLTSAGQTYVVSPIAGNIVSVYTAVNVQTNGASALTVKAPDGTVGSITITTASTVGTIDSLTSSLANTEVEAGEVIEIENDATPTAGAITVTIILGA
jgi:hypothetical protein